MTPASDPKPAAPFEIVLTKGNDGAWIALIERPLLHVDVMLSRLTGEGAEREAKASALRILANLCSSGVALPPEVEGLFRRRIA